MERLQEAMSRARARREESLGKGPAERAPGASQSNVEARDDSAWQRLQSLHVNERLMKSHRLVAYFGGKPAQPFDMMRTKIMKQTAANDWHRLVVTSPGPRCGKTTLTANLAFSLARQSELRVLVIEVDMRRPQLSGLLGMSEQVAFARYMSGDDPDFTPHMVRYGNNLAFACNTVPASNSSELLHSSRARDRLDEVERVFQPDLVLFDAPPVLPSDDTLAFLDYADCALIVAAAEQTSINEIDVTEAEVAGATNVLGVVLNKTRLAQGSDSYNEAYY